MGIRRAIRYTATHIPKCKLLSGKPERLARQFAAHAPAASVGSTPAATSATQKTTEKRDFRGIAAEEPEEEEPEVHLPPEAQHRGSRRSGAMDPGVSATLVRTQRQAGIHHLDAKPTKKQSASFHRGSLNCRGIATMFEHCRGNLPFAILSRGRIIRTRVMKQLKHGSTDIFIEQ